MYFTNLWHTWWIISANRVHGGSVVSTAVSQQQVYRFNSWSGPFCARFAWSLCACVDFLPQSKICQSGCSIVWWCKYLQCITTKVWLDVTLMESQNTAIQVAAPKLANRSKWAFSEAVQQAKSSLRHWDIVGQVQQEEAGLRSQPKWHKTTPS